MRLALKLLHFSAHMISSKTVNLYTRMKAEELLDVHKLNNDELVAELLDRVKRRTRVPVPNALVNVQALKNRISHLMKLGRQKQDKLSPPEVPPHIRQPIFTADEMARALARPPGFK